MTDSLPTIKMVSRHYAAPKLTIYGAVSKLTANGSKNSIESNGGICKTPGDPKIRC